MVAWIRLNFDRGFWAMKIFHKHKNHDDIRREPIYEKMPSILSPLFPIWIFLKFITKPSKTAFYTFISEIGWHSGLYYAQKQVQAKP